MKVDFYLRLQNTENFALKASSVVLVLINNRCNWKPGEQQPTYFDHNTKVESLNGIVINAKDY